MPEQLVVLIAIVGIVLVGLAFTSVEIIKDAGRFIGLGLLAFLAIILLNRTLPPQTATPSPNAPNAPNQSPPSSYTLDNAYKGFSGFVQSALNRIDEFVYGSPYVVGEQPVGEQPVGEQPGGQDSGQRLQPNSAESQPPEQQGYQIQPDGVPSRVSTLVQPGASGSSTTGLSSGASGSTRPVSAWW